MSRRTRKRERSPADAAVVIRRSRATDLAIAAGLIVVTAIVYAPIRHNAFVRYDDYGYIVDNPYVRAGLTWNGFVRAWTAFQMGYWHPLTMLSHMLDCQIFGVNPGAHHLVSVGIHIVNTLLLFGVLARMTAQPWRSAFVAGLFALHPLHVESVAWAAERKDVLSTCFWLLSMWAYVAYVRRRNLLRYLLLLVMFLAALLCKGMTVTLPFALLLLDVWPLGRLERKGFKGSRVQGFKGGHALEPRTLEPSNPGTLDPSLLLVIEKLPLILLAGIMSVVTFVAQRDAGATAAVFPLADRLANAIVSYATYLLQMLWPTRLAVLYIFEAPLPAWQVAGSALLLTGLTGLLLWGSRRRPYLLVGWLWYVGTLVPASHLVHVGSEGMADRFTYVPLIGIFIIVAWGIPDLLGRWPHRQAVCSIAAAAVLVACSIQTSRQLLTWRDTTSLFEHALAVTRDNYVAHSLIGLVEMAQGRHDDAFQHYTEIVRIAGKFTPVEPYYSDAQYNLGLILAGRGDTGAAKQHYVAALSTNPLHGKAHAGLAAVLAAQGDVAGAVAQYREALRLTPDLASAHTNLAIALENLGQTDEAIVHYTEAVRLEPQRAEARCNLAAVLAAAGRLPEAAEQYRAALSLKPDLVEARVGLARIEGGKE